MAGWRISAFCHETEVDHGGGAGEEVTADQVGSPEREMEITVQPRETADLQMREPREGRDYMSAEGPGSSRRVQCMMDGIKQRLRWKEASNIPRKPLPPQTTSFLAADICEYVAAWRNLYRSRTGSC